MNCKECIHYEVCSAWWVFVENFDDIRTEESCDYFKKKKKKKKKRSREDKKKKIRKKI